MAHGTVAILTEGKFEDLELFYPKYRLQEAGFDVVVVTPDGEGREGEYGYPVEADLAVADADPSSFDALHLPGGAKNPDKLRMDRGAVELVRRFWETGRPVFAICHAPWMLVEADVLEGQEMTSWWSLRKDCENAGASWRDAEVVATDRLVTSRQPPDLPAFMREALRMLEASPREAQKPTIRAGGT